MRATSVTVVLGEGLTTVSDLLKLGTHRSDAVLHTNADWKLRVVRYRHVLFLFLLVYITGRRVVSCHHRDILDNVYLSEISKVI